MSDNDIYSEIIEKIQETGADVLVSDKDPNQVIVVCKPVTLPIKVAKGTGTILERAEVAHRFALNLSSGLESINKILQREGVFKDNQIIGKPSDYEEAVYTLVENKAKKPKSSEVGYSVAPKLDLKKRGA